MLRHDRQKRRAKRIAMENRHGHWLGILKQLGRRKMKILLDLGCLDVHLRLG